MIHTAMFVGVLSAAAQVGVDPAAIDARLVALASSPAAGVRVETLATTGGGRPIRVVMIKDAAGGRKPTLLIVAGIDARYGTGVELATALAERFAASPPAWLQHASLAVIPCLNPDGFARQGPIADFGRLVVPGDQDHDGRTDEDGGDDLDGDGRILMMRVKRPAPSTGLTATLCQDTDFPMLLRQPDTAKGEQAQWALLLEGIDNDADGRFNEDGVAGAAGGGLDLDMQWPAFWPEFQDGAGTSPLQTVETRSLATWCLAHQEVAAVLVLGRHDTLVTIPEAGKMDPSGQVPLGIEADDKAVYEAISAKFKEVTGITESPGADSAGSFLRWSYTNLGVLALGTPAWVRPDLVKEEKRGGPVAAPGQPDVNAAGGAKPVAGELAVPDAEPKDAGKATLPGQPADKPAEKPAEKLAAKPEPRPEPKSDESKWLRHFEDRQSVVAFVPWKPWTHPQLGEVEIGGFVPNVRINAPTDALPRLIELQAQFIGELAARFPTIESRAWATALAPGLWRIDVQLTNTGRLPTRMAIGAKSRAKLPTLVTIDVDVSQLVSGTKVVRAEAIGASGGSFVTSWTVRTGTRSVVKVSVTDPMMETVDLCLDLTSGGGVKP